MIFKQTLLNITDSTNIKWLRTFHLYRGFSRKVSYPGFFIKGSARVLRAVGFNKSLSKLKLFKKGAIVKVLLTSSKFRITKLSGTSIIKTTNSGLILKKKFEFRAKYFYGFNNSTIKRKKITAMYRFTI